MAKLKGDFKNSFVIFGTDIEFIDNGDITWVFPADDKWICQTCWEDRENPEEYIDENDEDDDDYYDEE